MGRRRTTWVLVAIAMLGCASTQYRNEKNPNATPAQLNSDVAECRQNSMVPESSRPQGYDRQIFIVDEDMLARCLAARGWTPVSK